MMHYEPKPCGACGCAFAPIHLYAATHKKNMEDAAARGRMRKTRHVR